jgi:hypothetical protein
MHSKPDKADFIEGEFVVFFYHEKMRSGHVENVGDYLLTLKLSHPQPDEREYKSFYYDKMRNLTKSGW